MLSIRLTSYIFNPYESKSFRFVFITLFLLFLKWTVGHFVEFIEAHKIK